MTLLDERYQPLKFNSVNEILENFFKKRLEYYEKRKKYSLDSCKETLDDLTAEIKFVNDVVTEKLVLTGKNKKNKDIEEDMKKLGHSMSLLKKIHIHRITPDGLEELKNKHQQTQAEFERLSAISPRQTWKDELSEFLRAYCRKYNETPRSA
jgi:DNA topoisomerase-2